MPGVQSGVVMAEIQPLSSRGSVYMARSVVAVFGSFLLVVTVSSLVVFVCTLLVVLAAWFIVPDLLGAGYDVALDGRDVIVSRDGKSVRVPIEEIREIKESRWTGNKTITLVFRRDIGFGHAIEFSPEITVGASWADHPTAKMLRQLMRDVEH